MLPMNKGSNGKPLFMLLFAFMFAGESVAKCLVDATVEHVSAFRSSMPHSLQWYAVRESDAPCHVLNVGSL